MSRTLFVRFDERGGYELEMGGTRWLTSLPHPQRVRVLALLDELHEIIYPPAEDPPPDA